MYIYPKKSWSNIRWPIIITNKNKVAQLSQSMPQILTAIPTPKLIPSPSPNHAHFIPEKLKTVSTSYHNLFYTTNVHKI